MLKASVSIIENDMELRQSGKEAKQVSLSSSNTSDISYLFLVHEGERLSGYGELAFIGHSSSNQLNYSPVWAPFPMIMGCCAALPPQIVAPVHTAYMA